jgi:PAS domain S-box-containing protein
MHIFRTETLIFLKGVRVGYVNGTFPEALSGGIEKLDRSVCRVLYVSGGSVLIRAHGAVAEAVAGTLVFFPSASTDDAHRITGTAQAWSMVVDMGSADAWIRSQLEPLERAHACCWHAHLEPARQARWESRFQYMESCAAGAVNDALRGALRDVREAMSPTHPHDEEVGDAVLAYICDHYRENVSLAGVAEAVGYSPAYLTDRVKRETGLPVHRWLLYYRIAESKHLLRDTNLPIEQVAESVGFGSGNYFSRQFVKVTGQSPAAWRTMQRHSQSLPDSVHRFSSPPAPWGLELDAVIDATPQIVWIKDASGALIFANKRWFDYSGLSEEDSSGWGWTAVIHPDDAPNCIAEWRRALRSRTPLEFVARIRRQADARYRAHLFRTVPHYAENGRLFWIGTATDLEDRLRRGNPTAASDRSQETSASA